VKTGDKVAVIFFGVAAIACGVALFLPAVQQGDANRGPLGALGLPAWVMVTAGLILSLLIVVWLVVNNARGNK
jgi:hypothetical protein